MRLIQQKSLTRLVIPFIIHSHGYFVKIGLPYLSPTHLLTTYFSMSNIDTNLKETVHGIVKLLSCPLASSLIRIHPNDLGSLDEKSVPKPLEFSNWWEWAGKSVSSWKQLILVYNELLDRVNTPGSRSRHNDIPDEVIDFLNAITKLSLPRNPQLVLQLEEFDKCNTGMSPKKYHEVSRMTSYICELLDKISDISGINVKHLVDIGAGQVCAI